MVYLAAQQQNKLIQFPVCANIGVRFTLDILSQACYKHIQTRFFSLAISVLFNKKKKMASYLLSCKKTTGFNRLAKFIILSKHRGYDNFGLNCFHRLSKSPAIPFTQVSADSFRFNIQECSRSLYALFAFRPTCFARRLVMQNLHATSTQHAR